MQFWLEFPENPCQNVIICYHWRSAPWNSEIMHRGILFNMPYIVNENHVQSNAFNQKYLWVNRILELWVVTSKYSIKTRKQKSKRCNWHNLQVIDPLQKPVSSSRIQFQFPVLCQHPQANYESQRMRISTKLGTNRTALLIYLFFVFAIDAAMAPNWEGFNAKYRKSISQLSSTRLTQDRLYYWPTILYASLEARACNKLQLSQ